MILWSVTTDEVRKIFAAAALTASEARLELRPWSRQGQSRNAQAHQLFRRRSGGGDAGCRSIVMRRSLDAAALDATCVRAMRLRLQQQPE